jgi:TPR repeat protein
MPKWTASTLLALSAAATAAATASPAFARPQAAAPQAAHPAPSAPAASQPASEPAAHPAAASAAALADDLRQVLAAAEVRDIPEMDEVIRKMAAERYSAWRAAAEKGDPIGQYFLARCFQTGAGVPRSTTEGFAWLQKSADQKLPIALEQIGHSYRYGVGVRIDDAQAMKAYQAALDLGLVTAGVDAGELLRDGTALTPSEKRDPAAALKYFQTAAAKGDAWAMVDLGLCHKEGIGVPKDAEQSLAWYTKAAEAGNLSAMVETGRTLRERRKYAEAMTWLKKVAEAGDTYGDATCMLGDMYEAGEGVARDHAAAVKWYEMADNRGSEHAKDWLARRR